MSRIYLDYAATTPLAPEVLEAMQPYLTADFGNASAIYREGQKAREAIDDARHEISKILECSLEEIVFTSGATEANNFALKGVLAAWQLRHKKVPHLITTPLEHSCILRTAQYLEEQGKAEVTWVSVDENGLIAPSDLKAAIRENTALVCVHAVNNEIGVIEPIHRIGKICRKQEIPFHTDAVQAVGILSISVEKWNCDLLSLSAHKFYGPKGIGLLYVRRGTEIISQMHGGGQERKYRSGTENVAAIVGMAKALQLAETKREEEAKRLAELQQFALELMQKEFPAVHLNGPELGTRRTPANLHFSFGELDGESLLIRLDLEGIAVSLGSACSSGMLDPSHVLSAIGGAPAEARSGVRITMGRQTQKEDLEQAIPMIIKVVKELKEREF